MCQAWEGEFRVEARLRKQEALAAEEAEAREAAADVERTREAYFTEVGRLLSRNLGVEPHILLERLTPKPPIAKEG